MNFQNSSIPGCGRGIRSWQYPIQFASYLTYLASKDIRSYVEIGARYGGTFIIVVEYIRRFADLYHACSLDIQLAPIMEQHAQDTAGIDYRIGDSQSPQLRRFLGSMSWDLAFIDGDHSYEGCSTDFQSVRQRSKLIALHDIANAACPGVHQVWQEIKRIVPGDRLFEATSQYKEVGHSASFTYLRYRRG